VVLYCCCDIAPIRLSVMWQKLLLSNRGVALLGIEVLGALVYIGCSDSNISSLVYILS